MGRRKGFAVRRFAGTEAPAKGADPQTEWLLYCDHIEHDGERLLQFACENDLEGIVAKPKNSPYQFTETQTYWLKLKNRNYTQALGREDLFSREEKKALQIDWTGCVIACGEAEL